MATIPTARIAPITRLRVLIFIAGTSNYRILHPRTSPACFFLGGRPEAFLLVAMIEKRIGTAREAGGQGQLPSRPNCKGPLGLPCAVTPRRTWPPAYVSR